MLDGDQFPVTWTKSKYLDTMNDSNYNEFFHDFLIESTEHLQEYERCLLNIEMMMRHDDYTFDHIRENVQSIFRSVHTIKGLAGMMDFNLIKDYAHEAESLLDLIRSQRIVLDDSLIHQLFEILDTLKKLIESIITPEQNTVSIEKEMASLRDVLKTSLSEDSALTPPSMHPEKPKEPGETVKTSGDMKSVLSGKETIRVDTKRLDELLAAVGELVIAKNRLLDSRKNLSDYALDEVRENIPEHRFMLQYDQSGLAMAINQISRLIGNLQETAMRLRMVPIGYTFRKFERVVRDLSKKNRKDVQLIIEGEATEVDRMLIESMEDPLLHLIRNALDHGIETPDIRRNQGKSAIGTLKLTAYQENNLIVIRIQDDGQGIDLQKIAQKAMHKGLIASTDGMTERQILDLIFLPGFSTAEKVTEVSGRGVGLDIVKKNILKLNGQIDVETKRAEGTTFILKLPLTLAIIQILSVILGKKRYAIPLSNVLEIIRISASDIQFINGHEAIQRRDQVLPLLHLDRLLDVPAPSAWDKYYIVVIGSGEKIFGVIVDGIAEQQDVVIKPLGNYLENLKGISGATILGNGEVCLVLDIASLWDMEISRTSHL